MLFRTLAIATALSIGLAVPASAQPTAHSSEPQSFRSAETLVSDIPAKPKKAKKNTKTLVIMAYAKKKDATTPALLKKVYFDQVDRWMRWQSAGRQGEKGKVTKWLKVASNTRCTDKDTYMARAYAAAKKAGYKPGSYQRIALYFPLCKALTWGGLGSMGSDGNGKYQVWINGSPYLQVIAHESLHNYGLIHSAAIDCGKVALTKKERGCDTTEYGDFFDIMGSSIAMSASAKREVGWLSPKQSKTVTSGTKTYTVASADSSSSALKLVRVELGKGSFLDVEYRAVSRLDRGEPDPSGVQVRLYEPHTDFDQYGRSLIDVLPNNEITYASIPAGQSWTSPGRVRISVGAVDGANAVVTVSFKAPAASAPAVPAAPSLSWAPAEDLLRPAAGIAALSPVSGNGMPVLEYDVQLANAAGVVGSSTVDALGGAVLAASVGDLDYGSYQVRYRARNEVGTGGYSAWSAPFVVTEPLPVIAAINVENQTVPSTFTWSQLRATVLPSTAGYEISRVYFTVGTAGGPIGTCEAISYDGPIESFHCSSDYDASYFAPGSYALTVSVTDSFSHAASRTVAFTVAEP